MERKRNLVKGVSGYGAAIDVGIDEVVVSPFVVFAVQVFHSGVEHAVEFEVVGRVHAVVDASA